MGNNWFTCSCMFMYLMIFLIKHKDMHHNKKIITKSCIALLSQGHCAYVSPASTAIQEKCRGHQDVNLFNHSIPTQPTHVSLKHTYT